VRNRHGKATDHYLSVGEELVVLPRGDYEELVDALAAQEIDTALARREEELLSAEEASALVATSSPIAFWRSKRGMTLALLAGEVGVSEGFLSERIRQYNCRRHIIRKARRLASRPDR
jgi:hypothetical protein